MPPPTKEEEEQGDDEDMSGAGPREEEKERPQNNAKEIIQERRVVKVGNCHTTTTETGEQTRKRIIKERKLLKQALGEARGTKDGRRLCRKSDVEMGPSRRRPKDARTAAAHCPKRSVKQRKEGRAKTKKGSTAATRGRKRMDGTRKTTQLSSKQLKEGNEKWRSRF